MIKALADWLSHIDTCHTQRIDLSLSRMRQVAECLKVTAFTCPVITVAGTNGKGSCVAALAAIYGAVGYQVGVFTSPHLLRFNERIEINSRPVSNSDLCQAFSAIENARADITLTFFEFATLAALYLFTQHPLDVIILEVGLGGRLDAVNLIDPDISVITSIDLDHTAWLGDTREQIAKEKAGIIRLNRPVVCGDRDPPSSLIEAARRKRAKFYCYGTDFRDPAPDETACWQTSIAPSNQATVLQVIRLLATQRPVSPTAVRKGFTQLHLPARWQQVHCRPDVILDVAHNPAASRMLGNNIEKISAHRRILAVFSCLADKDIAGLVKPLADKVLVWYIAPLVEKRGATLEMLKEQLQAFGVCAYNHVTVMAAYRAALKACRPQDCVIVFGSFHTVAAVLSRGASA